MSGRYVSRVFESALAPDLKFTAAVLASFADEDGYRIWPAVGEVAYLRGLKERQVQVHLKELRAMTILELVKPATQWFPAQYRLRLDQLPTRAPYQPAERQPFFGSLGESPPGPQPGVQSAAPLPGVQSSAPGVQPTAPDPSLDPPRTHTGTRAREARPDSGVQPAAPLRGESPLVTLPLIVAPWRDPDHRAHAWCVKVCVPKFLHKQFKAALGGPVTKKPERLRAFYAETIAAIPVGVDIGDPPVDFWRAAFAQRFGRVTREDDRRRSVPPPHAVGPVRRAAIPSTAGCPHHPPCFRMRDCIARTIAEGRAAREEKSG